MRSTSERTIKWGAEAIEDYNRAVLNGDAAPDSGRSEAAAEALRDVCASQEPYR